MVIRFQTYDQSQVWEFTIEVESIADYPLLEILQVAKDTQQNDDFAKRLDGLIKERKLTPTKLAKKLGINKSSMHNMLVGHTPLDWQVLDKLCEVLNCSLDFLMFGKPVPRDSKTSMSPSELFIKGTPIYDGFCHITVTPLVPRISTRTNQIEGDDDD